MDGVGRRRIGNSWKKTKEGGQTRCVDRRDMEELTAQVKVKIVRGVNLAVRDSGTSDPYVVLKYENQRLKTHVIKKDIDPEWNEELAILIVDPTHLIKIEVYDKDMFSFDDKMGDGEIDIQPFMDTIKLPMENVPNNTIIRNIVPARNNCLAQDSPIYFSAGKILQDVILRLKHVETGELQIQLQWVKP